MNRHYIATGVATTDRYLRVYVTAHVGTTIRFIEVKVPWRQVAQHYHAICDGMEQVFADQIKAEQDEAQLSLPGID